MPHIPKLIPLLVMLALAAAACGSDAEALSKPEYVEQADAICQRANDQLEPLFETFYADLEEQGVDPETEPPSDSVFVAYQAMMTELADVWGGSLEDLRALAAPEGDENQLERLYDDFETALEDAVRISDAAAEGGSAEREAMEQTDPFHDVNTRARVYGLAVCGSEE